MEYGRHEGAATHMANAETSREPIDREEWLTVKQKAVLDLLLEHKSSKEIARTLGISPFTVDQRIASARKKFDAATRAELARAYAKRRSIYEDPVYEASYVAPVEADMHLELQALPADPVISLADVATFEVPAPWQAKPNSLEGLEILDQRFGIIGRVAVICGLALAIAVVLLTLVAVAESLSRLI